MSTRTTGKTDTNVGFHPPAATDAAATRSMLLIILFLLVAGTIIAVVVYNRYNRTEVAPVPTGKVMPPQAP